MWIVLAGNMAAEDLLDRRLRLAPHQVAPDAMGITTNSKALEPVIIRYSPLCYLLENSRDAIGGVGMDPAHPHLEAVSPKMADPKLVGVASHLAEGEPAKGETLYVGRGNPPDRNPLPGDALAVLEAGIPKFAAGNSKSPGQLADRLEGRKVLLLQKAVRVLARAAWKVGRDLFDNEVLTLALQRSTDSRQV
jgi:hypothetical protein